MLRSYSREFKVIERAPTMFADNDEDRNVPSQIDVYKFRRQSRRFNLFGEKAATDFNSDGMSNIYYEVDNEQRPRTYAILQDRERNEFSNNRLRSILLIYSRPAWKIFILTFIFTAYVLDSCLFTFCHKHKRPLWLIFLIIVLNFTFTLDVAILVGVKVSKKWRKILNLMEPDTFRVILDIVLALPFTFFYLTDMKSHFDLHALSPLVATLRAYRIIEYFYTRASQAGNNQWTSFLSQYLILFVLSVHTWTCVWYLFAIKTIDYPKIQSAWSNAAIYLPTETTSDWYFLCVYWSVMCLTTNALGDLYPVTTGERIMAALSILLGFLLTTIVFVGSLTSQFITFTTRRSKYVRRLRRIQNHLKLIKMDTDTTDRIIRYYEDLWYQKSGVFKPKLLQLLPYPLQMEICYDLNAVPLYSSLLFRKLPEAFLRRLSLEMTHQFYLPGDIVYFQNNNKNSMICITNGVLELLSDEDDESPMISFAKGTCFGEISLVYSIPARCTVKAATYVECQVLEKTKFIKLMITYPDLIDGIRNSLIERIERCIQRKQTQKQYHDFSLNIYASKDRKKSSIKCLKDKLRYIQGKTESDNFSSEDYLDENCLDLYILSEHVKKKTVQFTCINTKFPWILESECHLVKYWELYMLLVVFYISIAYPYYIGFERRFSDGFMFFAQIIIAITIIFNLLMTSTTAVKTKKKYITTWTGIMSYRLNTLGFYLDLISIIPFEYIVTIHSAVQYQDEYRDHLFYLCKGVKLVLVWRISAFFEDLEKKILLNTVVIKIVKYCIYICLLCYWCGVVLYMESCFVSRCSENSWFNRAFLWDDQIDNTTNRKTDVPIVTATYFSTSLLLSVGYGDMSPGDKYDMGIIAFMSVYGVLFSGYCISEFSAVVTHLTRTKTAFLEIIMTIEKFFKENNMHEAIKSRIMACYDLQWQYNLGAEITGDHWLDKAVVPLELRKKVLHQARFKALTSIPFFQVKNKAFIHTLTETARDMLLPPGEIVYYGGTVTRELYIIESGYCLIAQEARDKKKERIIGPGNHLGLLVLLYGVPAISTVVTLTHCKLISVSHSAYTSALSLFPGMKEHEGLMKPEELEFIKAQAKAQNTNAYLKHYNELTAKKKVQITNFLQELFNNSFIYLISDYEKNNQNYRRSYKQFHIFSNAASYLLLPIAIKPDGTFLKTWALIRVISAYLLSLLIPVLVAMPEISFVFKISVLVLEIVCYIDLYLMLHVAYYGSKNQLIYHPYLTALNHLKGRFIVDFLTCFPWYLIYGFVTAKNGGGSTKEGTHVLHRHMFYCTVRMINILQIWKIYSIFVAHSIHALKKAYFMSVLHFLLLTLFFLNFYTNILIILSCRFVIANDANDLKQKAAMLTLSKPYIATIFEPNGNMICTQGTWINRATVFKHVNLTPSRVYLLAYYWAATSFSGAGFGDIVAQDTTHMLLSICTIIHGTLFFGYVYARIASLKAMADQVVTIFQENVKHLELFMNRERVPQSLKKIVMEYWRYQWKRTGGWSHQAILGKLHANLNEDAVLYMYEKTLREIPLFENVEYSFFRAFAKKLQETYYQKGYMVMRSNEVISTMYIIFRGKVDVISDINEVETCMGPGGIFGNIKGVSKYLTMSNVVASRNIDVLCISGAEFYALLKSFPTVLRKVKESVESAPKDYVIPTISSTGDNEEEVQQNPLSYEAEDDDDDYDVNMTNYLESPEKSIAESHGSKSLTSIGNADYTVATLLLVMPHRWFRSSIIPDSTFITIIEYLTLILSYTDFIILVYQMAFQSIWFFFHYCITIDTIFIYKTFLDMHCGYVNRYGDYILNPKKVRKMYFSNVVYRRRDFLANLPLCYLAFLMNLSPEMNYMIFCFLRTPQLARISYLITFQTHRKTSIGLSNLFLKLMGIVVWVSILSHVNACLFFKLSCLTPVHCASENWLSKPELDLRARYLEGNYFAVYVAALWYVINLLTITGTGDVSSQNVFELLETIIIVIVIKFCTGLLISEMSAMISAHSSSLIAYDYGINELRDGLRDMDLSDHQMNKMWDYVRELWNRQQGKQMPNLVHKLPFRLRCQIMQAVYGSHIRNSMIFNKTDDDFKRMLAMWMRHCVFFPGNYIVQCGDSDQCIYFIHRGQVEVLTVHPNLTESIYDVLGPEDSFGVAQGLFVGVSHHFSFRARTVVDIVYLKLDQWKYLLDYYPKSAKLVQRKIENVYLAI